MLRLVCKVIKTFMGSDEAAVLHALHVREDRF